MENGDFYKNKKRGFYIPLLYLISRTSMPG